jgi:hypothetical protein
MSTQSMPTDPKAVRVWRGYRLSNLKTEKFHERLGTVFIPAAVKQQIDAGLKSYIPTVLAGIPDKPDSVPDETAVLFWKSQEIFTNSANKLAMRIYRLLHEPVFSMPPSKTGFPMLFNDSLTIEQPVYLFNKMADWMHGAVKHLVAARPAKSDPEEFHVMVSKALGDIKKQIALEGAIACVGNDYLVYWELGPNMQADEELPSGIPLLKEVATEWSQTFTPIPTEIPFGLWDDWKGMNVKAGASFNMQFDIRTDI